MKLLVVLLWFLFTTPTPFTHDIARSVGGKERHYLYVGERRASKILRSTTPGTIRVVETLPHLDTPIGDTLTVWVRHYGQGMEMDPRAGHTEVLITCHPDLLPRFLQKKHVFPRSEGEVYVYDHGNRLVVVPKNDMPDWFVRRMKKIQEST